jgi:hypothetical protein
MVARNPGLFLEPADIAQRHTGADAKRTEARVTFFQAG